MSYRYGASYLDPGLNTLVAPPGTPIYQPYLYSWGGASVTGLNNTNNYSSPKQVGALTNWSFVSTSGVSAGSAFSIKTNGTIWSWGNNNNGQLGLNNTTTTYSPAQIGSLTNWANVSSGNAHTIAIKTDGTLWTWGKNNFGQLGLGNTNNYSSPVQVGALSNWSSASGGQLHTAAIKTDGTLWTWGYNGNGALGLNNTTPYSSPKQVGSLTNWLYVSCGMYFTIATQTNGTIWAIGGRNQYGQLGLNSTSSFSSPNQIGALTNWLKISAGKYFSSSIKSDGTLWAWGANSNGQLGINNSSYNYSSPKQIGALTTWLNISCGSYHMLATKTNKTLWSWGKNNLGQLGLGNITYYSSPKQVGSITTWLTPSAITNSSLVLQY